MSFLSKKYHLTTAYHWCDDYFISINFFFFGVGRQESGFKSLEGSFTHIYI